MITHFSKQGSRIRGWRIVALSKQKEGIVKEKTPFGNKLIQMKTMPFQDPPPTQIKDFHNQN